MHIVINRDSICMADDIFSHKKVLEIYENIKLCDFIKYVLSLPPEGNFPEPDFLEVFPTVGCCAWVLKVVKGYENICNLAVIGTREQSPKLLIDNLPMGEVVTRYASNELFMKYLSNTTPEKVYRDLKKDSKT